jgi:hypothetical protein
MAAKGEVMVSVHPANRRLGSTERRAAETALLSGKQAERRPESAERRARRDPAPTPIPHHDGDAR